MPTQLDIVARLRGALGLAACLGALAACKGDTDAPPHGAPPHGLFVPEPEAATTLPRPIQVVLGAERVPAVAGLRADFARGKIAGEWSFLNTTAEPAGVDGGVQLALATDGRAEWTIDVEADAVSHLLLRFAELPTAFHRETLRVAWRADDAATLEWNEGPSVEVSYAETAENQLLVPLASHPEWRGTVRSIGLVLGSDTTLTLSSIKAIQLTDHVKLPTLGPADQSPVDVEIDQYRRPALRTAPRSMLRRTVQVGTDQELVLGFALHPLTSFSPRSTTQFHIRVDGDNFSATLGPREAVGSGWYDYRLDLSPYEGETVRVELVTEPTPLDGSQPTGIPLWSEPRIRSNERVAPERPNLLLVSFDTLRADHLESYGYDRTTSPTVSRLAAEGVRFDHARALAPSTLPSHGSLFTGIDAIDNRLYASNATRLPRSRTTLADIVKARGYATAAFVGGAYFDPSFGLDRGFETYAYANTRADRSLFDYSDVAPNTRRTLDWLDRNHDRPFFLFFHTYEVHSPFDPREPYIREFVPEGEEAPSESLILSGNSRDAPLEGPRYLGWETFVRVDGDPVNPRETPMSDVVATYDSEIRVADEHLAAIIAALEEHGVLDDTLVVFTSDHGESFLEHGRTGHGNLYEENLRVPLVLRYPAALPNGHVVNQPVQLVDVAPTCLELLGIDAGLGRGTSLVPILRQGGEPTPRPSVAYDNMTGIAYMDARGHKLIANVFLNHPSVGRLEAFDLANDPKETTDLFATLEADVRGELEEGLSVAFERLPGSHLVLTSQSPARFEGTMTLSGSHTPLRRQLRAFPITSSAYEYTGGNAIELDTEPTERWQLHLHQGAGTLTIRGMFHMEEGTVTIDETIDLATLPLAPDDPLVRSIGEGPLQVRLAGRVVDPEAGLQGSGEEPSAGTLDQLRKLGYF